MLREKERDRKAKPTWPTEAVDGEMALWKTEAFPPEFVTRFPRRLPSRRAAFKDPSISEHKHHVPATLFEGCY